VPQVTVHSKYIASHNVLSVAVGTNCPQGGATRHGGRTLFRLKNEGSTDIRIRVDGKDLSGARSIEIILGGDAEAETFTEALEFAAKILREQLGRGREEID
jgi:hypothetical protein